MLSALRLCLLLGVILGVVAPKSSAALAQRGVIDDRVVVIRTAHGLQEITLDEPGAAPGPRALHEAPCLLVHALDGAVPVLQPAWLDLAVTHRIRPRQDLWRSADAPNTGFAHAPPRG